MVIKWEDLERLVFLDSQCWGALLAAALVRPFGQIDSSFCNRTRVRINPVHAQLTALGSIQVHFSPGNRAMDILPKWEGYTESPPRQALEIRFKFNAGKASVSLYNNQLFMLQPLLSWKTRVWHEGKTRRAPEYAKQALGRVGRKGGGSRAVGGRFLRSDIRSRFSRSRACLQWPEHRACGSRISSLC